MNAIRRLVALFALSAPLLLVGPAGAQEQPSGTVEIESTSVSLGIGTQSGHGVLTLNDGRQFPFTVKGLKIGDIGIATFKATGVVYRLADLNWFPGYYTAGEIGAVVGGGLSSVMMQNGHGVTMSLNTSQEGLRFTLAAETIEIRWE